VATSLFTSQTPAVPDANDGTDYTLGTAMSRSTSGQIIRGRWWCPTTPPSGTPDFVLYYGAGTELHREPWPGLVGGQWNVTPEFALPVDYDADDVVVPSVYTSGQYSATVDPAFWNGTDLVNGDITAPGATNGRLSNTDSYPSNVVDLCFFVDLVFADDTPPEGQGAVGLELAVAGTGSINADGVAAAGLELAVAASGAVNADGVAGAAIALTLATTGATDPVGVAGAGLVFTVAASGATDPVGTAGAGLVLTAAATGARDSAGVAAAGLVFTVNSSGASGDIGRPVTPWPWPLEGPAGWPWPPRPVRSFSEVTP
jgi:hypothetical protein